MTYSVITVCLNSAATIGRCIDSVLHQDVLPKEYVFVDGRSSDGTAEIIADRIQQHAGAGGGVAFKVCDQGGAFGITTAWNMGLAHCTADLVFILNSDDWYERQCAATVLAVMRSKPEADIVCARARTYKRGESTPCGTWNNRPWWVFPAMVPFIHPACFVRRQVYERVGRFDPGYPVCADYEFFCRCKRQGVRFLTMPDLLVNCQLGGYANSKRKEARIEVYKIATRYTSSRIVPLGAFAARLLTNR